MNCSGFTVFQHLFCLHPTQAHDSDVNVISWNALVTYMLASGADDGAVRIWDLRSFTQVGCVCEQLLIQALHITVVQTMGPCASGTCVASHRWELNVI